jgi:hypothetical protein
MPSVSTSMRTKAEHWLAPVKPSSPLNADFVGAPSMRKAAYFSHVRRGKAACERLTPLDERLARSLAAIPIEVQREGLSIAELQALPRGRRRGNCP